MALSFVTPGCAPEQPDVVPTSAQMAVSGNGTIHYTAPADGTVYIYDQPSQRLVWSGLVYKGQTVDLDSKRNAIIVGGTTMANKIMVGDHKNVLYFDRMPDSSPAALNRQPQYNSPPPIYQAPPSNYNNGVTVTPNVTVQPNGQPTPGSVTVQPGVIVTPTTQP